MKQFTTPEQILQTAQQHISSGNHPEAIRVLEQSLLDGAADARLYHLLGAEYAQTGEYKLALKYMHQALAHSPDMPIARFQLGLLHLTCAQPQEAQNVWMPLIEQLPDTHYLHLFSKGLIHLALDQFTECRQNLEAGIQNNQEVPVLNHDMQNVLAELPTETQRPTAVPGQAPYHTYHNPYSQEDDDTVH